MFKKHINGGWLAFGVCLAAACGWVGPTSAETHPDDVLQAINSRICWQVFWGDQRYKLGSTEPITLRQVGDVTYAWSYALSSVPHVVHWADFFTVYHEGDTYIVGNANGSNLDSGLALFEKNLKTLPAGNTRTLRINIRKDCEPRFEASTPLTERMLSRVVSSVSHYLSNSDKIVVGDHPNHLEIVVSNFNATDPGTYVSIPSKKQVLIVAFFINSNPFDAGQGDYVVNTVFPNSGETKDEPYNELGEKIMNDGIVRRIDLGALPNEP